MTPNNRSRLIKQYRFAFLFAAVLMSAVFLWVSCRRETPLPSTPTAVVLAFTATPTHTAVVQVSVTSVPPSAQTPTSTTTPETGLLVVATSSPALTPTTCQPPDTWVLYTILPGDTLFSLANRTDTTIEEIIQANCLASDLIVAYEDLYLPFAPPPPPPPPPAPTSSGVQQASTCTVLYECATPGPALVLAPGGGNDPDFIPCEFHLATPWIDENVPSITTEINLVIGQQFIAYACDFSGQITSAEVAQSGGATLPAAIYTEPTNPDLKMGNAAAVIAWPVLPTYPVGSYKLIIKDQNGTSAELEFQVGKNNEPFILVSPVTGAPGDTFDVYAINFPFNSSQVIQFFGEDEAVAGENHTLTLRGQWEITIDQSFNLVSTLGWAKFPLTIPSQLSPGIYSVALEDQSVLRAFWLR